MCADSGGHCGGENLLGEGLLVVWLLGEELLGIGGISKENEGFGGLRDVGIGDTGSEEVSGSAFGNNNESGRTVEGWYRWLYPILDSSKIISRLM